MGTILQKEASNIQVGHLYLHGSPSWSPSGSLIPTLLSVSKQWPKKRNPIKHALTKFEKILKRRGRWWVIKIKNQLWKTQKKDEAFELWEKNKDLPPYKQLSMRTTTEKVGIGKGKQAGHPLGQFNHFNHLSWTCKLDIKRLISLVLWTVDPLDDTTYMPDYIRTRRWSAWSGDAICKKNASFHWQQTMPNGVWTCDQKQQKGGFPLKNKLGSPGWRTFSNVTLK